MTFPVIHWFRRDLRLQDNLALHAAFDSGSPVIPLFILDPIIAASPRAGTPRMAFLYQALQSLDASLRGYGSRLLIRIGKPIEILTALIAETKATSIYFNCDYTPYARRRDTAIEQGLSIPVHQCDDAILMPPGSVLTSSGDPYTVFTPFRKNWNTHTKPATSERELHAGLFHSLDNIAGENAAMLKTESTIVLPTASEAQAQHFLRDFVEHDLQDYAETRNRLPINPYAEKRPTGTSYLSPYLRFGLLSPRQAYHAARDAWKNTQISTDRESIETWVSELTWREFYMHILHFYPHVLERDFKDTFLNLEWVHNPQDFQVWQHGMTGYPVVDAAMRQLNAIGWMPNRARMIVASFLTKDLLIHWREGEQYFMQHLLDGDPAANNGGWQWSAGTGTDAQPYFRIFNPVSQSEKFAAPEYLRYWLPELRDVPDQFIHAPWTMPQPPKQYPQPIVDHAQAREHTLAAFKRAKGE
jgi:deoxyribodipyrimidine photo-lyase